MKLEDIKLGDVVEVSGLECVEDRDHMEVKQDEKGALYIDCYKGKHYLSNMPDAHGDIPELTLCESHK